MKPGTTITLVLPLRTASLANEHTHWRARQKRAKAERLATRAAWWNRGLCGRHLQPRETAIVHLVRIAPRPLDSDNLPPSMKSVRDELAACLGLRDDRDPRVTWTYGQARVDRGAYAVNVTITFSPGADRMNLVPEIGVNDQLDPVPTEAIVELERVRRQRALIGIPGHVMLRIDDAPGKPPDWAVIIGETVVRKSGSRKEGTR